jgi:uncharacterized membrane-anchored protein YitT (DUF2179 family)
MIITLKMIEIDPTEDPVKMQVMIVTKCPERVINSIQDHMRRGITIINEAEGAYIVKAPHNPYVFRNTNERIGIIFPHD